MRTMMPIQLIDIDEAQVDLLNQVRRLQRHSRTLVLQKMAGQAAEFTVHSRNQLGQSLLIAAGPRTKKLCRIQWRWGRHEFPSVRSYYKARREGRRRWFTRENLSADDSFPREIAPLEVYANAGS
jgi:hypothetical protein